MEFNSSTIKDFVGQKVSGRFLVKSISRGASAKATWQEVILADRWGSTPSKIWQQNMSDAYMDMVGKPVTIIGSVAERNGEAELTTVKMETAPAEDMGDLVPQYSVEQTQKYIDFIRNQVSTFSNEELKAFISYLLNDKLTGAYMDNADSKGLMARGFYVEMANLVHLAKSVASFFFGKPNKEVILAAVICYQYGVTALVKKEGYSFVFSENRKLYGQAVMAAMLLDDFYSDFCQDGDKNNMISMETRKALQHAIIAAGNVVEPATPEAAAVKNIIDEYKTITEGGTYGIQNQ